MIETRILVRTKSEAALQKLRVDLERDPVSTHPNWCEVAASGDDEVKARNISEALGTYAVYWSISSGKTAGRFLTNSA